MARARAVRVTLAALRARLRLTTDWRSVLRHAWSVRLILLAALLSGIEAVLPLLPGLVDIPAGIFAQLSFFTTVAACLARIVAQPQSLPPASEAKPNPKPGE